MINFNKLSYMQAELDNHITLERQLLHVDYLLEKAIALCVELGEMLNEREEIFKYWKTYRIPDRQKALTEYVDGIHFLVSYANALGIKEYKYTRPEECDQRELVLGLFNMMSMLPYNQQITKTLDHYLFLGEKLNFTTEEIEREYMKKNEINHNRVETGY